MAKSKKRYSGIGGQAVMEGIMMKNGDDYAVAVRRADGEIEVVTDKYTSVGGNNKIIKLPFIRGMFAFVDSLVLGMKALTWSASFFDEEPAKVEVNKEVETGIKDSEKSEKKSEKEPASKEESSLLMGLTVLFSIVMAVGIFILIPYFVSQLMGNYIKSDALKAVFEGVLRLLIFVIYVAAISAMKDIRRVYQYHGAEHKCINCIERGYELNVKNVMKASRQHNRCGTSFMLFVMFVSIVLFMFIRTSNPAMRVIIRLLLIPVISGISYEIIRVAGKSDNLLVRIISAPGLLLQKLTTREPDEDMVEVAIKAVEAVFDWKEYHNEIQKGL